MSRNNTLLIASLFICLFTISCSLFQSMDAATVFRSGETHFTAARGHFNNAQRTENPDKKATEELLAKIIYDAGSSLVLFDMDIKEKKANAPKALPYFQEVIKICPNTDYAILSHVQMGQCYPNREPCLDCYNSSCIFATLSPNGHFREAVQTLQHVKCLPV